MTINLALCAMGVLLILPSAAGLPLLPLQCGGPPSSTWEAAPTYCSPSSATWSLQPGGQAWIRSGLTGPVDPFQTYDSVTACPIGAWQPQIELKFRRLLESEPHHVAYGGLSADGCEEVLVPRASATPDVAGHYYVVITVGRGNGGVYQLTILQEQF